MDGVNQRAADLQPTWYAATHGETPKSGLLDLLRRGSEETLTESGKVKHSGTHHGHPLATRAGIACMEVMTPEVYARLSAYGARIKDEPQPLGDRKRTPLPGQRARFVPRI